MTDKAFLNWPFFESAHRKLASELEEWCVEKLDTAQLPEPLADRCGKILSLLASGGWLKYVTTERYGGALEKLDIRSLCIIRETLAQHSGLADFVFAMQGLGSGMISLYGSEAQKESYLPAVVAGNKVAAFALTELSSGSDVANLATRAVRDGDHYEINGKKTLISNAGLADFYVLFARTGPGPGAKGISAFLVDSDAEGLDDSSMLEVNVPHPLGEITLDDCAVRHDQLLGKAGEGFKEAMATLDLFRPTVGAAALGFSRLALREATQHAVDRVLYGQKLADNPITQSKLADMSLSVDASALLVYRAAWHLDCCKGRASREVAMAKLFATESAQKTIDDAVQIFGGRGVLIGVPVEQLYREIRSLRIYEGASEVQKLIIARSHLASYMAQ